MSATPCPTGCGRTVDPGKLLCLPCWREVPKAIQREVYATWRAYSGADVDDVSSLREKRKAYWAARDLAIGSIG